MFDLNTSQLSIPNLGKGDVVDVSIKVNGIQIPDTFEVMNIHVQQCFNKISFAVIQLLDGDVAEQNFDSSDKDILSPGNKIEIQAGYLPDKDLIFKGIIIRHGLKITPDSRPSLEIECKDEAVKMTVGRKNKYIYNSKDSDIIESFANEIGLKSDVEDTGIEHSELVQYNATDWDFMMLRADANGLLVLPKNGKLIAKKPDFDQKEKFTINYGTSLYEFEAEMDARHQYPASKASTWDPESQELFEVEASASGVQSLSDGGLLGGIGNALGSAIDTVSSVGAALGVNLPGMTPNTDYSKVMGIDHLQIQHAGQLSKEELEKWAEAQYQKSQLAKKRGRVKFQGIADISPGDTLSLHGVGARHSGKVFVTAIRHEIDNGIWYTHAQFGLPHQWFHEQYDDIVCSPASGLIPAIQGLQIGIVTKLGADPNNEYRIQVRLPLVDAEGEGIWARVRLQDAGNDRSAYFLPEIDDEVIVGFINNDPRDAIILGAMHSSNHPSPIEHSNDNHEKGWITRSGMRMIFNDDEKSFTVETPDGKKIVIHDAANKICLEDQNSNKISMDNSGITIESGGDINLKARGDLLLEAINITNKANANFKAEGQSRAELTAAGEVVVKGSIARIN